MLICGIIGGGSEMLRKIIDWFFPPEPTEKVCYATGEVCRLGVCNGFNNSYCETAVVRREIRREEKLYGSG